MSLPTAVTLLGLLAATSAVAQGPTVNAAFPVRSYPQIGADELTSVARFRGKKLLLIQFASW